MASRLFYICVLACLAQNAFSQVLQLGNCGCQGNQAINLGNLGSLGGLGSIGLALSGANMNSGGCMCGGNYGNVGMQVSSGCGDIAVLGQLPVQGSTAVSGNVPVIGYVMFEGEVPAGGLVSVVDPCGCSQ